LTRSLRVPFGTVAQLTVRRGQARDLLLAAAAVVMVEIVVAIFQGAELHRLEVGTLGGRLVGLAFGAAATVPLAFRRRAPLVVLGLTGAATFVATVLSGGLGPEVVGPLVALYTVATCCPRAISLTAGWVTLCCAVVGVTVEPAYPGWQALPLPSALIVTAWLIGDNVRVRRAYIAQLEERAARAERDRLAEAERAAAGERARIARELHDVVAHHVSVMAIQAGAARVVAETGGTPATTAAQRDALQSIETTARQVLTELRRMLGVLRRDDHGEGAVTSLEPQPSIGTLDALIRSVRAAGLPVEWRIQGEPVPLASSVELSAYRIVQEALTNVLKHEGPVPTEVIVRYAEDRLDVEVVDTPSGAAHPAQGGLAGGGHGIAGMRERVALFGGDLEVGRRPDGRFRVAARLPLGGTYR
jgi:signal transduction histidine kinase